MQSLRLLAGIAAACCLLAANTASDRQAASERQAGERLAKQAEAAEKSGRVVEAYLLYAKAAAADRTNPVYWAKASALRVPASAIAEERLPVIGVAAEAPKIADPGIIGSLTRQQMEEIERMQEPPHLKPVPGRRSFHLRGDSKALYEQLAEVYGYTVIFDKDFTSQESMRFDLDDADYKGALHALEAATNTFIVVLSPKAMLVSPDTTQKRQDLEPNEALGVPISERTSIQEAQELALMVQQTLEIRRVGMDPIKRMIYMRDRASKIELAQALFNQLSTGKAQVSAEIEFLSVGKASSLNFGLNLPSKFPLVDFGKITGASYSVPSGFTRFLAFGGGASFLGLGLTDAALFATATRSEATSVLKTTMNASDGQPATFHVGDKYPIQTGAYLGLGGLSGGSTTYAVISTSSYGDITTEAVSTTGTMKLVVNAREVPITLPAGANNIYGLMNVINSAGLGIGVQTIQRGTTARPFSLLVVASTLGITSIQLFDDPSGENIALLKPPDRTSSISRTYTDRTTQKVSANGGLTLVVGTTKTPLILSEATNNLNGLRDAINASGAGVTSSILTTGSATSPFYMQIVANAANTGEIQVFDDPDGANTALFSPTDQVNAFGSSFGKTVSTSSSSASFGQTYTPPPTFNFEDLGLILKITPFVHDMDEVTLDIEAEFKVLGSQSYNGVPVISTRKYQGKVRLRTSQYAVVAGLVTESQVRSLSGFNGLTSVPLLGALLGDTTRSKDSTEILLVIKPTVTAMPSSEFENRPFWFGSEMKPLTLL